MEFGRLAKLDLRHVPYKGTPAALPDLITGRLPMYIASVAEFIEHHKTGAIRILATLGASRSRFLPDVPTVRESGFDIEAPNSFAMYAPAGTPSTVAERLHAAIIDALNNAEIRTRIETLGFEIAGTTGEALAQIQRAEYERWGPIIKASGFKADQFTGQGARTRSDIVITVGEPNQQYWKLSRPHLFRRVESPESSTALRGGQPSIWPFGRATAR